MIETSAEFVRLRLTDDGAVVGVAFEGPARRRSHRPDKTNRQLHCSDQDLWFATGPQH